VLLAGQTAHAACPAVLVGIARQSGSSLGTRDCFPMTSWRAEPSGHREHLRIARRRAL